MFEEDKLELEKVEGGKVWKSYPHDKEYLISEDGCISRKTKFGWFYIEQSMYKNGYLHTNIGNRKNRKTFPVHLIVAETFLGSRPKGCECHHKDRNKENNRVGNLEWLTVSKHRSLKSILKKSKIISLRVNDDQYDKLNYYVKGLKFDSVSQLIKACINKGLPLIKDEKNNTGGDHQ